MRSSPSLLSTLCLLPPLSLLPPLQMLQKKVVLLGWRGIWRLWHQGIQQDANDARNGTRTPALMLWSSQECPWERGPGQQQSKINRPLYSRYSSIIWKMKLLVQDCMAQGEQEPAALDKAVAQMAELYSNGTQKAALALGKERKAAREAARAAGAQPTGSSDSDAEEEEVEE